MTATDANLAVEVSDLSVRFGQFTAVDHISFSVSRGEIFGFLGANGAGKTTTIRVLCGVLAPTTGQARVAGLDVRKGLEPIKAKVGYMSQRFTLYDDLTVLENLTFAASLRKLPPEFFRRRMRELFEFIGYDRSPKTPVKDLPGGIKQQVSLAAALLHDPEIVFLDEPTAGVTPVARARFWALIRKLSEAKHTVFVTTHYMDEAEQCGRIALMRQGQLIALDTPGELKRSTFPEPILEATPPFKEEEAPTHGGLEQLTKTSWIQSVQPYGMRYHVALRRVSGKTTEQLTTELARLLPGFAIRQIQPSLEDVFIRRVEGDSA